MIQELTAFYFAFTDLPFLFRVAGASWGFDVISIDAVTAFFPPLMLLVFAGATGFLLARRGSAGHTAVLIWLLLAASITGAIGVAAGWGRVVSLLYANQAGSMFAALSPVGELFKLMSILSMLGAFIAIIRRMHHQRHG